MSKELFKEALNIVRRNVRDDERLSLILNTEGFVNFTESSNSVIIKLLEEMTNDTSEWIQYWCWECNFGKDTEGKVFIGDKNIDISTPDKLYDMITED